LAKKNVAKRNKGKSRNTVGGRVRRKRGTKVGKEKTAGRTPIWKKTAKKSHLRKKRKGHTDLGKGKESKALPKNS